MKKSSRLLSKVLLLALLFIKANAQQSIDLTKFIEDKGGSDSPFDKCLVIDNRIDTVFYTKPTGAYPLRTIDFSSGFSYQVSNFINSKCNNTTLRDPVELILAFDQFRITNIKFLPVKKFNSNEYVRAREGDWLYVTVNIYYKSKGDIIKIATVKTYRVFFLNKHYGKYISELITDIYKVAELAYYKNLMIQNKVTKKSKKITKGMDMIFYPKKVNFSKDSLELNVYYKWKNYPIINSTKPGANGFFWYFPFFQQNHFEKGDVELRFDPVDSTYMYLWHEGLPRMPLIVFFNKDYYVRIFENRYLKMYKKGYTFEFTVPYTYPNIYQWLSHNEVIGTKNPPRDRYNTTNQFFYPDRLFPENKEIFGIKDSIRNHRSIQQYFEKYRIGYFDMDTGDIIFFENRLIE